MKRLICASTALLSVLMLIQAHAETVEFTGNGSTYFLQNSSLNEGWSIHEGIFTVDETAAYCIEPTETVVIGSDRYETASWETWSGYSEQLKQQIAEYSCFGYGFQSRNDMEYWYASQILIWQAINPAFASTRVYRDPAYAGDLAMSRQAVDITDSINAKKQEIQQTVDAYHSDPQLVFSDGEGNALSQPLKLTAGETLQIKDNAGLLHLWEAVNPPSGFTQTNDTASYRPLSQGRTQIRFRFKGTQENMRSAPLVLKAKDGSAIQTLIIRGSITPHEISFSLDVSDARLRIQKTDADGNEKPAGDASFAGAHYALRNVTQDLECGTFVTDENGFSKEIRGLTLNDTYELKEIQAPKGYALNEKPYRFVLKKDNDTVSLIRTEDRILRGRIAIHKMVSPRSASGKSENEKGAVFTILPMKHIQKYSSFEEAVKHLDELQENEHDQLETDENGYDESHDLAYGTYMAVQTAASSPDLEFCDPFTFEIDGTKKEPLLFHLSNLINEYELKIIKKDAESGKKITLNSAAFQIFDARGNLIRQKVGSAVYDTFATCADFYEAVPSSWYCDTHGEKGTVTLPLKLSAGTYTIKEVNAPAGYAVNSQPVSILLSSHSSDEENGIREVTVSDERVYGSVRIHKSIGETDADTVIRPGDLYGIAFTLYAKEDILSSDDGSVLFKAGSPVDTIITDADGNGLKDRLPFGLYELRESETRAELVLNEETEEVKIDEEEKDFSFEIENRLTETVFSKKQASGDDEIPGAKLSVKDRDGNLIDEWISEETPHIIAGLKQDQEYVLSEEVTPVDENGEEIGYVKASSIRFTPSVEADRIIMKDSLIRVQKTDENGEPLKGAYLRVINENSETVDEWISDGTPHAVKGLQEGMNYVIQETESPDGYYRCCETVFVTDGEDHTVTLTDRMIKVTFRKLDEEGNDLPGALLSLYEVRGENETKIAEFTTEGKAIETAGILKAGTMYCLKEDENPRGVHVSADVYFVTETYDPLSSDPLVIQMTDTDLCLSAWKTDLSGNPVAGAHLCVEDEEGNVIAEWISSEEPFDLSDLLQGDHTYILKETEAPEGYSLMAPLRFHTNGDRQRRQLIRAVDRRSRVRLEITKTDEETSKPLAGAEFILLDADGKEAEDAEGNAAALISDEEGKASVILDWNPDGWILRETKAPEGYRPLKHDIIIPVMDESDQPVIVQKVTVPNQKKGIDTSAGSMRPLLLILSGSLLLGLCALAAYIYLQHSSRSSR